MPLTRRAALKGMVATAVGAVTGATVYGGGYERHRIGVTEATLPKIMTEYGHMLIAWS